MKYIEYVKKMQKMMHLYAEMREMRDDVVVELKQEGFSYDVIVSMMSISKGHAILAIKSWERKHKRTLPETRGRPKEKVKP